MALPVKCLMSVAELWVQLLGVYLVTSLSPTASIVIIATGIGLV